MRIVFAGLLIAAGLSAAHAQNRVDAVDVRSAGVYTLGKVTEIKDSAISTGHRTKANVTLQRKTTVIPATLNTVFGVTLFVHGRPRGKAIPVRIVWRYPEPGLQNPATGTTKFTDRYNDTVRLDQESTYYWNLSSAWTLVPGQWTFELWQGDRPLVKQTFTLQK